MAQLLRLEEFTLDDPLAIEFGGQAQQKTSAQSNTVEVAKAAAYEQGYSAGWEDSSNAASEDQTRIGADFSHNLQDLSFTFHEAKSHVIQSLSPLLLALVDKLLPELVAQTIGQKVLEEIIPLAELAAEAPIQVVVAPSNRVAIESLLTTATTYPIELSDEDTLGPGQVYFRSGKNEKHIDLDSVILKITEVISALEHDNQEAFVHG